VRGKTARKAVGRKERKGAKAQRRKGSGSREEIPAVGRKERKGAKVQGRKGSGSCAKIRENLAETALPAALDLHPIKPR
jgi:hypothetical protein